MPSMRSSRDDEKYTMRPPKPSPQVVFLILTTTYDWGDAIFVSRVEFLQGGKSRPLTE